MLFQAPPESVADVCGADPSFICREVLDRTDSRRLSELADVLFAKPLSILVVILVAAGVHWLLRRAIDRFVGTLTGGPRLPGAVLAKSTSPDRTAARAATLGAVLRSLAGFVVWVLAGITILGEIGINLGPLVASAGIAGLAIGFGAQSLVKDFLAGMFILIEDQFGVGDVIDAGEAKGTVEAVTLRTTRLRDPDGTIWHVPNGQILRVGNLTNSSANPNARDGG
ncbi:MAG: mechanosensitive ion channel family protein [Actinomycetota bacterium]